MQAEGDVKEEEKNITPEKQKETADQGPPSVTHSLAIDRVSDAPSAAPGPAPTRVTPSTVLATPPRITIEELVSELIDTVQSNIWDRVPARGKTPSIPNTTSILTMPEQRSVPAPSNDACDLSECFATFTSSERLRVADGDGYLCEHCGGDADHDATKRMVFHELPEVLVVHLKRFSMDHYGRGRKLNKTVHTPKKLDMGPFCTEEAKHAPGASTAYELTGIVSHSGSMGGGHYIAFVRRCFKAHSLEKKRDAEMEVVVGDEKVSEAMHADGDNGEQKVEATTHETPETCHYWYRVSDSHVQQVSEQIALSTQAFLLFYRKIKRRAYAQ